MRPAALLWKKFFWFFSTVPVIKLKNDSMRRKIVTKESQAAGRSFPINKF